MGPLNRGVYVLFSGLDIERLVLAAGPIGLVLLDVWFICTSVPLTLLSVDWDPLVSDIAALNLLLLGLCDHWKVWDNLKIFIEYFNVVQKADKYRVYNAVQKTDIYKVFNAVQNADIKLCTVAVFRYFLEQMCFVWQPFLVPNIPHSWSY